MAVVMQKRVFTLWAILVMLSVGCFWQVYSNGFYVAEGGAARPVALSGLHVSAFGKINPNTAPVASLARLPGIGQVKARRIVAYRKLHGKMGKVNCNGVRNSGNSSCSGSSVQVFRCPEDLQQVEGIGSKTIMKIQKYLEFGSCKRAR